MLRSVTSLAYSMHVTSSVRCASSAVRLVVGAVPEQVNIPLQRAANSPELRECGLEVEVRSIPEGTGRMVQAVAEGELDLALPVTDGMVVAVAQGLPIEVVGTYVQSPLVWAVAANANTDKTSLKQLRRMGVSRLGSGSHTMSYYMALQQDMDPQQLEFAVANNFANLRTGVKNGIFDAFLWETFTTQPYFASGELKKLADVRTPWPAFSFICNPNKLSMAQSHAIRQFFFPVLAQECATFTSDVKGSVAQIAEKHAHTPEEASRWLSSVKYSPDFSIDAKRMAQAVSVLQEAGVVAESFQTQQLWARNAVAVVTNEGSYSGTLKTSTTREHSRHLYQRPETSAQNALARGFSTVAVGK